ncbi:MAG: hypothetical protein DYG93_09375 [Leptolyngbya sp. PLA2]|nr:hypothetical protein [Leptolyngbya sp.]MCE7971856.1 hypothetical protein [Leptolyngbya sp. PL-A2]MCZ7631970.1 hypothetical protein [Phycisphaerales bacterium]MDL1904038.1 hypothetical protein [Synechococcales cyanobacterium CNB]GIK18803.1 MAG: hypothetical protein BroJett004_09670 [Planctomycetota bacterium]
MREQALTEWPDALEAAVAALRSPWFDRVAVLAETGSTQDAAWSMCAGRPGLLLVAGRQTAGRGRLGRRWTDEHALGLTMTIVLEAETLGAQWRGRLALAAGIAACLAAERAIGGGDDFRTFGLRWPNDAVERPTARKIAGVLVEVRHGLALVGVGLNVLQTEDDWPDELRGRAVSLRECGSRASRLDAAILVVHAMHDTLSTHADALDAAAHRADVLRGTRRTFTHEGRSYTGVVESISHGGGVTLALDGGGRATLPAETTSLVHERR